MSIGINMECFSGISLEERISLMKENGFLSTFCLSDAENVDFLIEKVQRAGIKFETLHAPLFKINDMWASGENGEKAFERMADGVRKCEKYGIPILVVHLSAGRPAPIINPDGIKRYDILMQYAKEYNVKIAYENSRCVANLAMALEKYEDAGFCWDIGHENCFTPGMKFMPYFADKLMTVHLHDNLLELDKDLHMLPFDGLIDMEHIARMLAAADYRGTVMLEVHNNADEYENYTYADFSPAQFYKRAAEAARKLKKMREKYLAQENI